MPDPAYSGVPADVDAVLLAGLPDDPAELVWPSQVWNAHLATCERPRRCPHIHDVVLPAWWVAKVRRGVAWSADPTEALAMAMKHVNSYRGDKNVTEEGIVCPGRHP